MATIFPRLDDQGVRIGWQARVRKKGYPQQTRTFRKKAEAEAWAKATESEMERGAWRDRSEAEATTLRQALARYAEEVSAQKKGYAQELCRIRKWLDHPLAHRSLSSLRGKDFSEYVKGRSQAGAAANTIRLEMAIVSNLFTVARKEWGLESLDNPAQLVRLPKPSRGRERRVEPGEWGALLAHLPPPHDAAVAFLVETGMRRGELAGMRWERVDLSVPSVLLPDTKNGTAREVPLSRAAVSILKGLKGRSSGPVWVVPNPERNPKRGDRKGTSVALAPESMSQAFARACQRAGLLDLHLHDIRHEATSRLVERGLGVAQVTAITGHKDLRMFQRYTHLRAEDLAKLLG